MPTTGPMDIQFRVIQDRSLKCGVWSNLLGMRERRVLHDLLQRIDRVREALLAPRVLRLHLLHRRRVRLRILRSTDNIYMY